MSMLLASLLVGEARATWTIAAVDPETEEVGAAGATCGRWVWMASGVAPGHGVVLAQGASNLDAREAGVEMLLDGATPEEVLEAVKDGDDALVERQYGVAALSGPAAAFNGSDSWDWYGSESGDHVTVQGNVLWREEVVTDAFAAYQEALDAGEPLSERLLSALEAGGAQGGDARCDEAKSAKSAFLEVADPGDGQDDLGIELHVNRPWGSGSPVAELRERYDAGETHRRCSTGPGGGGLGWVLLAGLAVWRGAGRRGAGERRR